MSPLRRRRRHPRAAAGLFERASLLASAVDGTSARAAELARQAVATRPRSEDDLVRAVAALCARRPDGDEAYGRLLLLLVDLEHRPLASAASLLALDDQHARVLLDEARRRAGTQPRGVCRGWALVAGGARLTAAERQAADGHLQHCRRCGVRLAATVRARRELLQASAATAAVLAGATAVATTGTAASAAGSLVTAKLATALVGAGAAVALGGGLAAVAQGPVGAPPPRPPSLHAPAEVATPKAPTSSPRAPASAAPERPAAQPTATSVLPPAAPGPGEAPPDEDVPVRPLPSLPVPLPTLPAVPLPTLPTVPLPTLPALPVPTLPALPVPLPSLLPPLR